MAAVVQELVNGMQARLERGRKHLRIRDSPSPLLAPVLFIRTWARVSSPDHLELREWLCRLHQNSFRTLRAASLVFERRTFHLPSNPRALQKHRTIEASDHQERERMEAASRRKARR